MASWAEQFVSTACLADGKFAWILLAMVVKDLRLTMNFCWSSRPAWFLDEDRPEHAGDHKVRADETPDRPTGFTVLLIISGWRLLSSRPCCFALALLAFVAWWYAILIAVV